MHIQGAAEGAPPPDRDQSRVNGLLVPVAGRGALAHCVLAEGEYWERDMRMID